ncbi:DsbA family protein [Psychroflexus tropicus]|uniref:DsbA family protein n=1 Tax=Psychroflexus tropicus TaxID=197345 RepID=UPI00052665EA|nr:DsbA family protein [Psychroflexus tropicus]
MTIVYVYDALCGWCYGFSPVIMKLQEEYKPALTIEVISGGMITGSRIGPIGEVTSYIKSAYKTVEARCDVKFGEGFLNHTLADGKAVFTSVPPAIALSIIKHLKPDHSLSFATALQKAIYHTGISPDDLEAYAALASDYGIDAQFFIEKMQDPVYNQMAKEDFKRSVDLGVKGFPTVFVKQDEDYSEVCRGYLSYKDLRNNLLTLKKNGYG